VTEGRFKVELKPNVEKHLLLLGSHDLKLIAKKLVQLEDNPYLEAKKLKGLGYWRIRVGDYRIIYTIDNGVLLVLVIRIGLRKDIYKKL
jgi:mRNA interferase RelE/StbE